MANSKPEKAHKPQRPDKPAEGPPIDWSYPEEDIVPVPDESPVPHPIQEDPDDQ